MDTNLFRIETPQKTYSVSANGITRPKEALSLFKHNVARTVGDGRVYFWSGKDSVKDSSTLTEHHTDSLRDEVFNSLVYDAITITLLEKGLKRAKHGTFYADDRAGSNLGVRNIGGNVFAHDAVRIMVETIGDDRGWISLLASQVVTPDGLRYNPDFSKANSYKVLDAWSLSDSTATYNRWLQYFDVIKYSARELGNLQIIVGSSGHNVSVSEYAEPKISFNVGTDMTQYWPEAGLKAYGPLDQNLGTFERDAIKVALIGVGDSRPFSFQYLNRLNVGEDNYLGFGKLFRVPLDLKGSRGERIETIKPSNISQAHTVKDVGVVYAQALANIKNRDSDFNVAIVEIPNSLIEAFKYSPTDLRDHLKTVFLDQQVATQILTESVAQSRSAYSLSNFALGLYVSAGGKPWRLEHHTSDTSYIGISFGIQHDAGNGSSEILVGIAEIFDEYGDSIGINAVGQRYIPEHGYHLSKDSITSLIDNLIQKYRQDFNSYPRRIVIHKSSNFNTDEITISEHLATMNCSAELIHVSSHTDIRFIESASRKIKRGTCWIINDARALLYTDGQIYNGKSLTKWPPSPLLIEKAHGANDIESIAKEILSLTKLNWNSMVNHEKNPVTLSHSEKVIKMLRAGLNRNSIVDDFRYYF